MYYIYLHCNTYYMYYMYAHTIYIYLFIYKLTYNIYICIIK